MPGDIAAGIHFGVHFHAIDDRYIINFEIEISRRTISLNQSDKYKTDSLPFNDKCQHDILNDCLENSRVALHPCMRSSVVEMLSRVCINAN